MANPHTNTPSRRRNIDHFVELLRSGKMRYYRSVGRVYRVPRRRTSVEPKRPSIKYSGYTTLYDFANGQHYHAAADLVIWEFFNGPIPDGMEINHKNLKKRDNRLQNLELVTHSENIRHGFRSRQMLFGRWTKRREQMHLAGKHYTVCQND